MPRTIRIHQHGGPEVLQVEEIAVGPPRSKQLRIRHTAIGLNFLDTYHRSGVYPVTLPSGIGSEGALLAESTAVVQAGGWLALVRRRHLGVAGQASGMKAANPRSAQTLAPLTAP